MRILIAGASGLLGINLSLTALLLGHEVRGVTLDRGIQNLPFPLSRHDLSQSGTIHRVINAEKPDVIINCVALTDVDRCEQIPEDAKKVNADLPGELARATSKQGIKLVQISTDAVFDGKRGGYTEEDQPSPLNVYAATKYRGELNAMQNDPGTLVCRVNFYGWSISGQRSLAEWVFNKLSSGEVIKGFTDAIFSPLLATDLAALLIKLIQIDCKGIYHVVNPYGISKYDFAVALARQFDFPPEHVIPASIVDAGLRAARSPNLNLDPSKLMTVVKDEIPDHETGIQRFHRQYLDGYPEQLKRYMESLP